MSLQESVSSLQALVGRMSAIGKRRSQSAIVVKELECLAEMQLLDGEIVFLSLHHSLDAGPLAYMLDLLDRSNA